ncbi:MAG: radical SAM protein [Acidobacteriota bacterium]
MPGPGQLDDADWMRNFRDRLARERVPISGILELTSRCNLKCVHCYLGDQTAQRAKRALEMSTDRVKQVIDDIADAGCLYLLITGGDPMVRKDFPEIYRHARARGLIVTVFCDGILASDAICDLFRELPPYVVEVSIYGATAPVYEQVTRIPGSHKRAMAGIRRLLDAGVRVNVKTVLMSINEHELDAMRALAEDTFGVPFRMDSAIFPCLPDGDDSPVQLRVSPERAVARELRGDADRVDSWTRYVEAREHLPPSEKLYVCGAGVTNFYIDPFGQASPCLMTTQYRYDLAEASFDELWRTQIGQLRSKTPRADFGCNSCSMRSACTGCPAFNHQDTGHEDVKSEYVCATTVLRWNTLEAVRAGDDVDTALRKAGVLDADGRIADRAGYAAAPPPPRSRPSRFTILGQDKPRTTAPSCSTSCGCAGSAEPAPS